MVQTDTEKQVHPVITPSPAPGTAVILADSSLIIDGKLSILVYKVLSYGSSTPALSAGSRICLHISGTLLHTMTLKYINDKINAGTTDTLVLHYFPEKGIGISDGYWTLTRIN